MVGASLLLCLTLLAGCVLTIGDEMFFSIVTDRPDNEVDLTAEGATAIFEIASLGGIGQAHIRWLGGVEPERILLRLHLRGLEELRLTDGDTVRTVTIQSTNGGVRQSIAAAGTLVERDITADDPLWLPTRIIAPAANQGPVIPLRDGYIEVELPPGVLSRTSPLLAVHWVDFFR
jgi:hypothetical protein